jgi:cellulose synthase/poly-beta-1,6-N-acetylglucosamine synthase-like glycosyltransferase
MNPASWDWALIGFNALTGLLLMFVAAGAIPVLATLFQFLVVPFHASINHYRKAGAYLPNVAVVVPAWNEGRVIAASIDRLMALDYPQQRLRVYVVDDASTDDTPAVVQAKAAEYPGQVFHLRREVGGQGKSHTLNHGIAIVLEDDWMEALLIMDADVIYLPDSLRKLTRHLADPRVGAVTAYVSEGSSKPNYLNRFIGLEYAIAQVAARRAQNVLGALAVLAGGAQLHSRTNIEALGGRIDTSTFAEDTVTTFETQLQGRRVVFEPYAVVLAEEPDRINALWRQRLRWARGNVQVTARYRTVFFRPSRTHRLGGFAFGAFWFSIYLQPIFMILSSIGLIGLLLLQSALAVEAFRGLWIIAALGYVYGIALSTQLDAKVARRSWREALLFPGFVSLVIMIVAVFPGLVTWALGMLGSPLGDGWTIAFVVFAAVWNSASMLFAWLAKQVEKTRAGRVLAPLLVYLVGYGPILCAITLDSYIKEFRGVASSWEKTEKTGRAMG